MPNEIFIIKDRCTGCGSCVKVCPTHCISMEDRNEPGVRWKKLAVIDVNKCVFCNACVVDCDKLFDKTKAKGIKDPDFFHAIVMNKEASTAVTVDTTLYKGVWCFAEQRHGKMVSTIYELLNVGGQMAKDLGEELSAVLIGHNVAQHAQDIIERGADKVYVMD